MLVLATNFFNLLDLRPGRSLKALVLLGAALTIGSMDLDPLWALGLFLGPLLVLLPLDLRERGMLGDTGSNVVGAVAGLWLILTLDTTGQLIALAVIGTATVYGEFRSISRLIDRTPGLRHLDSLGRIAMPDAAANTLHLRHGGRRLGARQGDRRGLDRPPARVARRRRSRSRSSTRTSTSTRAR